MDPFVFVHIPKTAGTSFRLGADQYFGAEKACRDYGSEEPETSELVKECIHKERDFWAFSKAFQQRGCRYLVGHFPAGKYAPLFGIERMITFLRDPVQRILSEYSHFVRLHGYSESLQTFYRSKRFVNRQIEHLRGLPWAALGFIGVTEQYEISLELINRKYSLSIPLLEANKAKEKVSDAYEIDEKDAAEIRRLNAADMSVYRQVCGLFRQRLALDEAGKPFVRGMIGGIINGAAVGGWAVQDDSDAPVPIEVLQNGNVVGNTIAKDYRPHLRQIGVRRGGYAGYFLKVPGLKIGDTIEVRVAETEQPLLGSPRKVTDNDLNC